MTVIKLRWYIVALIVFFCWPSMVFAEPVFSTEAGGIRITLYSDKCQLKDQVSNLPVRATWEEGGKTFEGCVGSNPQLRMFIFYFSDRSAVVVPMAAFERVVGV